ncbi:MAG: hypothetical protein EXS25_03500 [Pedosphaera sp.]|nr:hypothetical protein [Pedosphaera sp.]
MGFYTLKYRRHLLIFGCAFIPFLWASVANGGTVEGSTNGFIWSSFLGPFHMVFLHLPIGFLTLTGIMELWAGFRPFEGIRRLVGITLALSLGSTFITSILGLLRAQSGEYTPQVLALHRNTGLALVLLTGITLILHPAADRIGAWSRWFYRGAMSATMALLMIAGHQGGTLTHGRGFLSLNSPTPLKWLMEELNPAAPHPDRLASLATTGAVTKIFAAKCITCHGPDKQKAKLRVDQLESLIKGGESGEPAVVPGDPAKSRLVRLILLPRSHSDRMPPEGKEQLTGDETLAIIEWIISGAGVPNKEPSR